MKSKGIYKEIDYKKVKEIEKGFSALSKLMKASGYTDIQARKFKDDLAATKVGIHMGNIRQNEFDGSDGETYFENKPVGLSSKKINATFPDLPIDGSKIPAFYNGVLTTVSVMPTIGEISYMLVFNSKDVADIIDRKFQKALSAKRSTVTLTMRDIMKAKPAIVAENFTRKEVVEDLKNKYRRLFKNLNVNDIHTKSEMEKIVNQTMEASV